MIVYRDEMASASVSATQMKYLTTGQGVFETLLYSHNCLWFWQRHARRLQKTLEFFNASLDHERLWRDINRTIADMDLPGAARVKVTVLFPVNRKPKKIAADSIILQVSREHGQEKQHSHIHLKLCPSPFGPDNTLIGLKTINYGYNLFMARDEQSRVVEEGLFYDLSGNLLEASRANIFAVHEGRLFTPALNKRFLAGIVRSILVEKLAVRETRIHKDDLKKYDCFFLTGSVREILPVASIDQLDFPTDCAMLETVRNQWQSVKEEYLNNRFV